MTVYSDHPYSRHQGTSFFSVHSVGYVHSNWRTEINRKISKTNGPFCSDIVSGIYKVTEEQKSFARCPRHVRITFVYIMQCPPVITVMSFASILLSSLGHIFYTVLPASETSHLFVRSLRMHSLRRIEIQFYIEMFDIIFVPIFYCAEFVSGR